MKNPTDLFSENFIQIYNSSEIKTVKEVAKRKAEARKHNEDAEAKLTFFVKDGSYFGSKTLFDSSIMLALGVLIALFLPCFEVSGKNVIGYLAFKAGVLPAVFLYLIAVIAIVMFFVGMRGNYKILEGNEFMNKSLAIGLKVAYLMSGLVVGVLALVVYFLSESYEYGLTIITACGLTYMVAAMAASFSIKPARKDAMTYTYVVKFAKYKLRTNTPRKLLKIVSLFGAILSIAAVGLGVAQIFFGKVKLVEEIGLNSGIFATITEGFYAIYPYLTDGIFRMIVCGLVAALVIAVNISNIIASNKVKTTDYNGYLKDEQTKKVRKHLSVNFALDILSYVLAYALIIASLTASVEGTKLLYEYYMIPILTVVSLLTALRYLLYTKVYCAFRGAETYEITGFSEVKLDEEKKQKKLAKKNGEAPAEKPSVDAPAEEKKEKPKKEKKPKKSKAKADGAEGDAEAPANTAEGGNA